MWCTYRQLLERGLTSSDAAGVALLLLFAEALGRLLLALLAAAGAKPPGPEASQKMAGAPNV